ncbi:hypothetical protein AKJ49_00330 [candidate division MSBL1 archaeon SCGC-AAA382A03]|uniref:Uncharacterized protein n=1 Tax=candidate division MSBL1 archaeon SCGC-AAA382A03 TaxID=1698278 RepID=A0A133VGU1_9EURY|nr:hypothetical protein AKJ49_00330 [candidate division MSBL1 archaeon SCGC-AAA382A03]
MLVQAKRERESISTNSGPSRLYNVKFSHEDSFERAKGQAEDMHSVTSEKGQSEKRIIWIGY